MDRAGAHRHVYGTLDTNSKDYKSPAVLNPRMYYELFINTGSANAIGTASFTGVRITPASAPAESTR